MGGEPKAETHYQTFADSAFKATQLQDVTKAQQSVNYFLQSREKDDIASIVTMGS